MARQKTYKLGIVITVLNYFKGPVDLLLSAKTRHNYKVYIQPQYRHQVALSAAWNNGMRQAFADGCDFAIVCNDDIMFGPTCIDAMVAEYFRLQSENVVMVTPVNEIGRFPDGYGILECNEERPNPTFSDHPNFSCFMVHKDFPEIMGWFDENFYPAWSEDVDMHHRIYLAGKRAVTTTAAPMIHFGQVTTNLMNQVDSTRSTRYFYAKWGSHNITPPQAYSNPYGRQDLTYKDWIPDYVI